MTNTHLDKQVSSQLTKNGVRYTRGRQAVVARLAAGDGPMTVPEIHGSLRSTVPLSSLYRTLQVLSDSGVVSLHHSGSSSTRYELAEWLMGHHHHLICTNCGSVDDIEVSEQQEAGLAQVVKTLAEASGFSATDHSLEIDGVCHRCHS